MANGLTYTRKTTSPEATKQLASTLARYLHPGDVVVLEGDLGAGKTQFVQGVAQGLGIKAPVTSPTFNILLSYEDGTLPLYHFDLYRLERVEELEDIGYYETVEGDGVTFIEWGEKFPQALPCDFLRIRLSVCDDASRLVEVRSSGERSRDVLFAWTKDSRSQLVTMS